MAGAPKAGWPGQCCWRKLLHTVLPSSNLSAASEAILSAMYKIVKHHVQNEDQLVNTSRPPYGPDVDHVKFEDLRETVAVEVARRNEQNTVSTLVRLQERLSSKDLTNSSHWV